MKPQRRDGIKSVRFERQQNARKNKNQLKRLLCASIGRYLFIRTTTDRKKKSPWPASSFPKAHRHMGHHTRQPRTTPPSSPRYVYREDMALVTRRFRASSCFRRSSAELSPSSRAAMASLMVDSIFSFWPRFSFRDRVGSETISSTRPM